MLDEVVVIGVLSGLLALERRAFLQAMISRPLPAGACVGLILGDVETGVAIGMCFELLFLGSVSLGGSHPDHETIATVVAAAAAGTMTSLAGGDLTRAIWAWCMLVSVPTARIGAWIEAGLDIRARKYLGRAQAAASAQENRRVARQNLRAMWPHFVLFGILGACGVGIGLLSSAAFLNMPAVLIRGLGWAFPAMVVVSASLAVAVSKTPGRGWLALGGTIAGASLGWLGAFA